MRYIDRTIWSVSAKLHFGESDDRFAWSNSFYKFGSIKEFPSISGLRSWVAVAFDLNIYITLLEISEIAIGWDENVLLPSRGRGCKLRAHIIIEFLRYGSWICSFPPLIQTSPNNQARPRHTLQNTVAKQGVQFYSFLETVNLSIYPLLLKASF